jgi:hypothetical protein
MHNELRYQAKTHAISKRLPKEKEKKNYAFSPPIFFFFFFNVENNRQKNNKNMLDENKCTNNS